MFRIHIYIYFDGLLCQTRDVVTLSDSSRLCLSSFLLPSIVCAMDDVDLPSIQRGILSLDDHIIQHNDMGGSQAPQALRTGGAPNFLMNWQGTHMGRTMSTSSMDSFGSQESRFHANPSLRSITAGSRGISPCPSSSGNSMRSSSPLEDHVRTLEAQNRQLQERITELNYFR